MNVSKEVEIRSTPRIVWDYILEEEKFKQWNTDVIRVEELTDGATKVGTRSKVIMKEGNRESEYHMEVTGFRSLEHIAFSMTGASLGKSPMNVSYDLAKERDGVRLRFHVIWNPQGFWLKVLSPLISFISNRGANTQLKRLSKLAAEAAMSG